MLKILLLSIIIFSSLFSATGEEMFWQEVRDSNNIELLELYKNKYPNGTYEVFADIKINKLLDKNKDRYSRNLKLISSGKYSCSSIDIVLEDDYSAKYTNKSKSYNGVWSSNGFKANTSFDVNGLFTLFIIKSHNDSFYIFKMPNKDVPYCNAKKE
jgi:hypothetical protein